MKGRYPLEGCIVLDVTQALAGPFVGTLLGDLGAEVYHIERTPQGDLARNWIPKSGELSHYFAIANRNKKSLTLDLGKAKGKEIFFKLAEKADVIVENFRAGKVKKLGIGYEEVKKINPGIIYCHVSGFGQDGPYKDRAAFDQVLQGETGIISYTGTEKEPCKINIPITDYVAALYGVYAVLSLIVNKEKNGEGGEIDVSLFDSAVNLMLNLMNMSCVQGLKDSELRMGSRYFLATPYEPFMAQNNSHVNICVATEHHWRLFCKAVGLEEIMNDSKFENNEARLRNREELREIIERKIKEKSRDEWIEILEKDGVPCGAVNSITEVMQHPQLKHRKTVVNVDYPGVGEIKLFNNPVKFSGFEISIMRPPRLGEHSEEILKKFGYSDNNIKEFRKGGII